VPVSKTERALEATDVAPLDDGPALDEDEETTGGAGSAEADGAGADEDADEPPPDSTAEMMAQVDQALERYAARVEEYAASEPMADPDAAVAGNGDASGAWRAPTPGTRDERPAPATEEDEGFFVIPEAISPTAQLPVAEPDAGQDTIDRADGEVETGDGRRVEPDGPADDADRPAVFDDEIDDDEIDDDDPGPAGVTVDRTGFGLPVSDDLLEELRRADIDGPTVELLPQDDTTATHRRPRRSPDYDPAPVPIPAKPPRLLGRKPRVRKVTRVVRHVDPWSVFKIALIANLVLYVVLLTAGVLLWNVANATGTVDNVERFFESFGWSSFEFDGGQIYHSAWIAGLFAVIGLTGIAVLLATLFNLITDLVGGMRFTVLEEEVVERRTSPMRRFVVRRPEPEVPAVIQDHTGPMIREAVVDDSGTFERTLG
jgi:hypothetical protein